jgi:hypothetical protein
MGDGSDSLIVSQTRYRTAIDNLKDSSFRFGCGVGTLIENPPHVAVALRGPGVVIHTRALVVTGTPTRTAAYLNQGHGLSPLPQREVNDAQ